MGQNRWVFEWVTPLNLKLFVSAPSKFSSFRRHCCGNVCRLSFIVNKPNFLHHAIYDSASDSDMANGYQNYYFKLRWRYDPNFGRNRQLTQKYIKIFVDSFENMSGLKININKTVAVWIGSFKSRNTKICNNYVKITWNFNGTFDILGIHFKPKLCKWNNWNEL